MGEIADMMIDGTMCQYCGVYLHEGEDGPGYPQNCDSCNEDGKPRRKSKAPKIKCLLCDRKVTKIGLSDHMMASHASLITAAPDLLAALEASEREYKNLDEGAPVDAGCIDCTCGTVPNTMNTGLCAHHLRAKAIAKAKGDK